MGFFFQILYNSRWLVCKAWPLGNVLLVFYPVTNILVKLPWQVRWKQSEDKWYFKKEAEDGKPVKKPHCTSNEQSKIFNLQNLFWDGREKINYQERLQSWLQNHCSLGCVAVVKLDPLFRWSQKYIDIRGWGKLVINEVLKAMERRQKQHFHQNPWE